MEPELESVEAELEKVKFSGVHGRTRETGADDNLDYVLPPSQNK